MRYICRFLAVVLMLSLCGCAKKEIPQPTQQPYAELIEKLEAGDYSGAKDWIDEQEAAAAVQTETAPIQTAPEPQMPQITVPESQVQAQIAGERIVLTKENVDTYFEIVTSYRFGKETGCMQEVRLKEAYQSRLLGVEDVTVDVSYLWSDAYGKPRQEQDDFLAEYYDITDSEVQIGEIEIMHNGIGSIARSTYSEGKGCFTNYASDLKILYGTGTLILDE